MTRGRERSCLLQSMIHTLTVDLTDTRIGGNLMDITFRSIQQVQIKSILIILNFMLHRLKRTNDTFQYIIDHAIEEINTTMSMTKNNTVHCTLSRNLQGPCEVTCLHDFIAPFRINDTNIELCCVAPAHSLEVNDLVPYLIRPRTRRLFVISLEKAETFQWESLMDDLFCGCRFCREQ